MLNEEKNKIKNRKMSQSPTYWVSVYIYTHTIIYVVLCIERTRGFLVKGEKPAYIKREIEYIYRGILWSLCAPVTIYIYTWWLPLPRGYRQRPHAKSPFVVQLDGKLLFVRRLRGEFSRATGPDHFHGSRKGREIIERVNPQFHYLYINSVHFKKKLNYIALFLFIFEINKYLT